MKNIEYPKFSAHACVTVCAATLLTFSTACTGTDDNAAPTTTTTVTSAVADNATSTPAASPVPDGGPPPAQTTAEQPGPQTVSDPSCQVGGNSVVIDSAIAQIAPPMAGVSWVPTESNFNSCSDFVYVQLETEGGTASSPYQLLLFHDGRFLGTGTSCNLGYQTVTGSDDDQVDVTYRYIVADEPNAAPQGEASVTYRWNGSGVEMIGELPGALTHGEC